MDIEGIVVLSAKLLFVAGLIYSIYQQKWINALGMTMIVLLIAGVEWSLPSGMRISSLVNGDMDKDECLQVIVGAMMFSGMILGMLMFLAPSIAKTLPDTDE